MLEGVTLAQVVELVVKVLVDLAGGAVADEQTTEDTHAAHPEDLAIKREENKSASLLLRTKSTLFGSRVFRIEISCIPGHTGVLGTLALTQTAVTTDAAGLVELTGAGAGVHGDGLADDEAIADELADGLTGVGVGDLVHLIGVEPNLALAAADHGGGEALLGAKVDPVEEKKFGVSHCHTITSNRDPSVLFFLDMATLRVRGNQIMGYRFSRRQCKRWHSHLDVGVSTVVGRMMFVGHSTGKSRQ